MQGQKVAIMAIAFLFSSALSASLNKTYYPKDFQDEYYKGTIAGSPLKNQLHEIISGIHQTGKSTDEIVESCPETATCYQQVDNITYREAREFLFGQLHLEQTQKGYVVEDVYCQTEFDESFGVGPKKIPDHNALNCEHTWPQSRFSSKFPKLLQKNDIHHLYPSDSRANSSRSNHIFAMVSGRDVHESCQSSRRGMAIGSSQTAFQPPEEHRGNVARALFYFSVRYKINIGPLEEGFLREWHREDPVDSAEKKRNDAIFTIQKNRNPFIDEPLLVEDIRDF